MTRAVEHELGDTDRDERLGEAIEAYLALAEGGHAPDPVRFAEKYPDLEEDLRAALDGLELVRGLVGSASGSGPGHGLESGRRVAGYKIVRELGRGGMGIVYEAVHVGLDRPVALKVLGTSAAPDSSGRRRFLNEARTAAGLHHTHIVPVFDVGQVGGLCYYAMQRIEGSGLDRVVKHLRRDRSVAAGSTPPVRTARSVAAAERSRGGSTATWGGPGLEESHGGLGLDRLPVAPGLEDEPTPFVPPRGSAYYRWVASLGRQAAEALAHAHQRGVIHRDVKPSNLLVDARGVVWMADFGLARRLADPSQTQVDSLLGTPRYMSPEQAKSGAVDGRGDIYSLGATLYELLTLRPPFDGKTAPELIDQITHRDPAHLRQFDRRIPLDLETIVLKALAKRPADRYATAQEFADDLGRFLAHEPVKARRIGPVGRAWRVARRHPSLTAVSTVSVVAIIAAWTLAYHRVVLERDDALQSRKEAQDSAIKAEMANKATREVLRTQLYQQAQVQRLSDIANRRSTGLGLLKQAADLDPDATFKTKLRDEAMALLSQRDVVARPSLDVRTLGMAPIDERRIALIADVEEGPTFQLWDLAKAQPIGAAHEVGEARIDSGRPEFGQGPGRGRGSSRGFGFGFGFPRGHRVVSLGTKVAAIWPNGRGIRVFDAQTGEVDGDLPLANRLVLAVYAVGSDGGRRVVTVEWQSVESPDVVNRNMRNAPHFHVNLWNLDRPEAQPTTLANSRAEPPPTTTNGQPNPLRLPLVAVAADGSRIATAWMFESEVALFGRDGAKEGTIDTQAGLTALAVGPHGMIAAGATNGGVQVWEPGAKASRSTLASHQSFISHLRFCPDDRGLLAVAGTSNGAGVELWDLTTPSLMAVLPSADGVSDVSFTLGGKSLIVARNNTVAVWSVIEPAAQFGVAAPGRFPRVEYGPGGQLVMSSSEEGPRLWKTGDCTISGGEDAKLGPCTVAFDPKGRLVAVNDSRIVWMNPANHKIENSADLPEYFGPFKSSIGRGLAQTPSGNFVAFVRLNEVLAWSAKDPGRVRRIELQESRLNRPGPFRGPGPGGGGRGGPGAPGAGGMQPGWSNIAVSPDASRLYLLNRGEFRVYELDEPGTGTRAVRIPVRIANDSQFSTMTLRGDGRFIAIGDVSGRVVVVSTRDLKVVERLARPEEDGDQGVFSLAYSPDGFELAVGTREHVRLWLIDGVGRPEPLVRLDGHRGFVRSLAFGPDGRQLASGGAEDKVVKIWDLKQIRSELAKLGLGWSRGKL